MYDSMERILVQIYEVQEPREAEAVAALGVDQIGTVILSREGWKAPVLRETVRAVRGAGARSGLIPLFGDRETVLRTLDFYQPDFVHFCEALSPFPGARKAVMERCETLIALQQAVRKRFPAVAVMRSLSIPRPGPPGGEEVEKSLLAVMDILAPVSDYFLLDTIQGSDRSLQEQPVAGFVGITGETCDWNLAQAVAAASPIPVILAGGLDAGNVFAAIRAVRPAGVDSCTRTNARDGEGRPIRFRKDLEKVKRLVEEVRRAEAATK
jgi:phosphoribosylanthranilate isomerase